MNGKFFLLAFWVVWLLILASIGYTLVRDQGGWHVIWIGLIAACGLAAAALAMRKLSRVRPTSDADDVDTPAAAVLENSPDAALLPATTPAGRPIGQTVAAVGLWCWALIAALYSAALLTAAMQAAAWPQVQGRITESVVTEQPRPRGTETGAYIEYRYRADNKTYYGTRVLIGAATSGRRDTEELVAKYAEGSHVRVYVHPDRPWLAVLEPRVRVQGMFFPLLCLLLPALAGWIMWHGRRDAHGHVSVTFGQTHARQHVKRPNLSLGAAATRLLPGFLFAFAAGAMALRVLNEQLLLQPPSAPVIVRNTMIWGVWLMVMVVMNRWWLPALRDQTLWLAGMGVGLLSALSYTYVMYIPIQSVEALYFRNILALVLAVNVVPLLPVMLLLREHAAPVEPTTAPDLAVR